MLPVRAIDFACGKELAIEFYLPGARRTPERLCQYRYLTWLIENILRHPSPNRNSFDRSYIELATALPTCT